MSLETMTTPYSSDIFHQIPDLAPVRVELEHRNGKNFVQTVLGPLIKSHGLQEIFGVGLLHRHFDIEADQKLVEFNNVTTPWKVVSEINKVDGRKSVVYETSWVLNENDRWMAYEYAFSPNGSKGKNIIDLNDSRYKLFLAEFTALLKASGYDKLLGLRAWPGKGFRGGLEFTAEKSNIFLVPGEFSFSDDFGYTETMWFWADGYVDAQCNCRCGWTKTNFHLLHNHVSSNTK